ncbi:flagellar motor protein MotB [Kordiimonas pumila]|uniref:Flagellar motor protein MotB n=1 Tax=Kordiimonas pumila TaxID=2161677 RepID=A0ABV7D119_9PROT|nr:flagellar motor protein MotB [Kordiimonas pumila]
MADDDGKRPIIIKKINKVEGGGHHGGAWKVAYADFTTAMMAFFMLLWLLNVAPPETLAGLADYFSPTTAAVSGRSGQDAVNPTTSDSSGLNPSPVVAISRPGPPQSGPTSGKKTGADSEAGGDPSYSDPQAAANKIREREDMAFKQMEEQIKLAIQQSPALNDLKDHLTIEITEDGMKIQLIDKDQRAMFHSGSANLYEYAKRMIEEIGTSIQSLPNRVTIQGHTDGGSFTGADGSTNWELSADRANSARRVLDHSGVSQDRIFEVVGKAGTDPLYPDQPAKTENRRITILVLREAPVVPPNL